MSDEIEQRFWQLRLDIASRLDRLHDALLAKLRTMARSTGQRTRADRL